MLAQVREISFQRSYFLSLGFTSTIFAHSISEEVVGFLVYGSPEENYLCLLSLLFIAVHVILSVKDRKIMLAGIIKI